MKGSDPLELETRRRLWQHIARRPGLYLRELQRETGLAMGALEYHLNQLTKAQLLSVIDDGRKRYFPSPMENEDRHVLAFLRQELPRRILVATLQTSPVPKAVLQTDLHVARSTLDYHLQRLEAVGLVLVAHAGRDRLVSVTQPERVERLLVTYRSTFLDRTVDAFLAGFDAMHGSSPSERE